jgi:hypothetical protein
VDHATQRDEIIKRNTYYETHIKPRATDAAQREAKKRQTAALVTMDAQHRKKITTIDTEWPPRIEEIDAVTGG